jgi:hypothetical protein
MENLRKRQRVDLVQPQTHPKKYQKLTSDTSFKSRRIITENLAVIHRRKTEVKLNRPTYVGMCVLDLSKLCMYQFYYDVLKVKYQDNIHLLYTDTDSLIVEMESEDINKDLIDMADYFDFNDYPVNHPVRQYLGEERVNKNKKIPGLFKDECNGQTIVEFIGLRPKMYSIIMEEDDRKNPNDGKRQAKGVPSKVVKKRFHHERFNRSLFNINQKDTVTYQSIRSEMHVISTVEVTKVGLSPMDDKKWITDDGITTMAYGDYRIN